MPFGIICYKNIIFFILIAFLPLNRALIKLKILGPKAVNSQPSVSVISQDLVASFTSLITDPHVENDVDRSFILLLVLSPNEINS